MLDGSRFRGVFPDEAHCKTGTSLESIGPPMADDLILETRRLTKEFEGFVAVSNVDLRIKRGTIHALIGPNGAGKTTVFNLLTRFLRPTRGQIVFNGTDITRTHPALLARRGMARSFQISAIFPTLRRSRTCALPFRANSAFRSTSGARKNPSRLSMEGQGNCWRPSGSRLSPSRQPASCRTVENVRSSLPLLLLSIRRSCSLTSRPQGWVTRTSRASCT